MVLTVMKIHFPKRKLGIITYQKYKNIRSEILLKYSLRENHKPFVNPEISKVIMTKLESDHDKDKA